jgi:hypothetical protein
MDGAAMMGPWTISSEITSTTQFSDSSPIVSFAEFVGINDLPPSSTARIVSYSYNSEGAAHDIELYLAPITETDPQFEILLEQRLAADSTEANSFTKICGPKGLVVPRIYGIVSSDNQPPSGLDTDGRSYRLFLRTANKADVAVFTCTYVIAEITE